MAVRDRIELNEVIAALREGFRFVGVERHPDYCRIAEARLADAMEQISLERPRRPK